MRAVPRKPETLADTRLDWREAYDREMNAAVRPLKMAAE